MISPRLQKFYLQIICEDFLILYNFTNVLALPKFERAILSSTSNRFTTSKASVVQSFCANYLQTNQKCISTRARKSVDLFKIRKSNLLGLKLTLRNKKLFSFLDKFSIFVLPKLFSKNQRAETRIESNFFEGAESNSFNNVKSTHFDDKLLFLKKQAFQVKWSPTIVTRRKIVDTFNYFAVSNRSSLSFFEVSQLSIFFDSLPGFALSFYFAPFKDRALLSKKRSNSTSFLVSKIKAEDKNNNFLGKNIDLYQFEKTNHSRMKGYTSVCHSVYNLQEQANFSTNSIARKYKMKKQLLSAFGFPWFVK